MQVRIWHLHHLIWIANFIFIWIFVCVLLIILFVSFRKLQSSTAGLLADWLSLLDPEIVSRCPSVEQHLLFFQQQTAAGGNQPTQQTAGVGNNMVAEGEAGRGWCQPYLLALLTHQGSLRSVQNCIHRLLSMDAQQQRWEAKHTAGDDNRLAQLWPMIMGSPKYL